MCAKCRTAVLSFLIAFFCECVISSGKSWNRFNEFQESDSVLITRCDIACFNEQDLKECRRACMKESFEKLGDCPGLNDTMPVFVLACVFFCSKDSDCPSTEKCCEHSCGQTCKPAIKLFDEKYLPPVPVNLTARERKRKGGVRVTWEMPSIFKNSLILYVLEERHHIGPFYNEPLLGEWNPILSSSKNSVNLKNTIKAGYWYQFRVASVNINGTKGFSMESEGFKLARWPKLQKPTKLRIEQVREKNNTIWGMVKWNPSESSIPIRRYKIFWSHRLDDRDLNYKSESVLVEKDSVPEVQAVAFYGRNSLKSKMATLLFKTYKLEDQYEIPDIK